MSDDSEDELTIKIKKVLSATEDEKYQLPGMESFALPTLSKEILKICSDCGQQLTADKRKHDCKGCGKEQLNNVVDIIKSEKYVLESKMQEHSKMEMSFKINIQQIEAEQKRLSELLNQERKKIDILEIELMELKENGTILKNEIEKKDQYIYELEKKIDIIKSNKCALEAKLLDFSVKNESLKKSLQKAKSENKNLAKLLSKGKKKSNFLETESAQLKENMKIELNNKEEISTASLEKLSDYKVDEDFLSKKNENYELLLRDLQEQLHNLKKELITDFNNCGLLKDPVADTLEVLEKQDNNKLHMDQRPLESQYLQKFFSVARSNNLSEKIYKLDSKTEDLANVNDVHIERKKQLLDLNEISDELPYYVMYPQHPFLKAPLILRKKSKGEKFCYYDKSIGKKKNNPSLKLFKTKFNKLQAKLYSKELAKETRHGTTSHSVGKLFLPKTE